jgi:hypothetical protein
MHHVLPFLNFFGLYTSHLAFPTSSTPPSKPQYSLIIISHLTVAAVQPATMDDIRRLDNQAQARHNELVNLIEGLRRQTNGSLVAKRKRFRQFIGIGTEI